MTTADLADLTATQRATIAAARPRGHGVRAQAVDHRVGIALVRKGYAVASYRQTGSGVLMDLALTKRGVEVYDALRRARRAAASGAGAN